MQSLHEILPEMKSFDFKLREMIWESAFTKYLKQEAARWLCNIGYNYCLSKASDELEWYLLNRNKSSPYKIMTGWKEWTFCNGLIPLSKDTWMEVFYMYLRESDYSILKFLACSKSASIILQYMHLMANMTNVTATDRINSFCTIVARHAKNTPLFDFILDDLETIKPKEISFITALTMIINHVYSKQQLNKTEIMQSLHEIIPEMKSFDFKLREIIWESAFTKYLKQEAARWLCNIGYDYCLSKANDELEWYLWNRNKSSPYKIMTGWKEWTFCNGLTASNDTWMEVFYMYSRESDYSILKFLACSKSASIILQYMHLMANMTNVTAIDRINSFCTIVARHAKNTPLFDFILDDLETIKPKEISFITAFTMIINHLYSKQQINEIKKYMDINLKDNLEFAIKYEHHENGDTVWKSLPLTMNMIIMYVNRKIELRFVQIRTQLYQYRYLTEGYDYTFK